MTEIVLIGLDGGNPLAFLAALGTLRALKSAWPHDPPKIAWKQSESNWRPEMVFAKTPSKAEMLAALDTELRAMNNHAAFTFAKDLNVFRKDFRSFAKDASVRAARERDLRDADFAAAFACDGIASEKDQVEDTAFRTMSGAGHQHFLESMDLLAKGTTPEHLSAALFSPWGYADPRPSMRWDPGDDRRYALRWDEPSGDPVRTVRGANRLAVEALPLFPVAPVDGRLATTGFTGTNSQNTFLTWPIWTGAIGLDTVRSLLALEELQAVSPDRAKLVAIGIAEIYRSRRITVGKYRNFTPAQPT